MRLNSCTTRLDISEDDIPVRTTRVLVATFLALLLLVSSSVGLAEDYVLPSLREIYKDYFHIGGAVSVASWAPKTLVSHRYLVVLLAVLLLVGAGSSNTLAWEGMPVPPLHVEGNQLKDPADNSVLLHGWMQPTASYFNGQGKWYLDPWNWKQLRSLVVRAGVSDLLSYMKELATVMSDTSPRCGRVHGWYCNFVRVNTDSVGGWSSAEGLIDSEQFDAWIANFLVPYANHLWTRGIYLVLCATGPVVVNVDGDMSKNASQGTQERLLTFWERVASAPGVKNADNIMFELMNEPVKIESAPGNGVWGMGSAVYFKAFAEWLKPIIDVIRGTGANNIIWVPTLEWQGSPHQWVQFPFSGENIGIAAHFYPAYGGVFNNAEAIQRLWQRQYKPAADRWPMIITEMFWTPYPDDPRNLVNGSTAGFGNSIKKAIDDQGNVSYLVGFIGDLLEDLNQARPSDCSLSPREGAQAYFDWLKEYASQTTISHGHRAVPGKIEAERYERMSGIRVESTPKNLSDRFISYTDLGSWASYLIGVAEAGSYVMDFRLAAEVDAYGQYGELAVRHESGEVLGVLTADSPQAEDWHVGSIVIDLAEGEQELVLEFRGGGQVNVDWFELSPMTDNDD